MVETSKLCQLITNFMEHKNFLMILISRLWQKGAVLDSYLFFLIEKLKSFKMGVFCTLIMCLEHSQFWNEIRTIQTKLEAKICSSTSLTGQYNRKQSENLKLS